MIDELIKEVKQKIYFLLTKKLYKFFITPPAKGTPIYTMGSADPRTFVRSGKNSTYRTFSGADIKVTFAEKGKEEKVIGSCQSLDFRKEIEEYDDYGSCGYGQLTTVYFVNDEDFLGKRCRLLAVAASEYGDLDTVFDEEVYFNAVSYGISVDDIVTEKHYDFKIFKKVDAE